MLDFYKAKMEVLVQIPSVHYHDIGILTIIFLEFLPQGEKGVGG